MAASMCDVFSFCMGVAGRARVSVEVRFVSSSKVRPEKTPTPSGLGNSPVGPLAARSWGWGGSRSVPAHRLRGGHAVCRGLRGSVRAPCRGPGRPVGSPNPAAAGGAGGGGDPGAPDPGCGPALLGPRRGGRGGVSRGNGGEKSVGPRGTFWGEVWVGKGLGVLKNLERNLRPVGAFEGFEQEREVMLSLCDCFFLKVRYKTFENACKERR